MISKLASTMYIDQKQNLKKGGGNADYPRYKPIQTFPSKQLV